MSIPSPLFNCRQATLLVERSADEALPRKTRLQLWAHIRFCPYCRRYEFQTRLIARGAKAAAQAPPAASLPPAFKARLQQQLTQGPSSPPQPA